MIKLRKEVDLTGYTLVLPSVAVGNVGQLAVDILISSIKLERIGHVLSSTFIPVIGADPYDENSKDLCTATDLFCGQKQKIIILQIRSPLIKKPTEFFNELLQFVNDRKIAKVIILTSSYGHEKRDEQLRTVPLRYVASPNIVSEFGKQFEDLKWIQLEPKVVDYMDVGEMLQIPGGGFAKCLYEVITKANIPCVILLKFCSEGDNIPDAVELTNYLNQWTDLIPKDKNDCAKIIYPPSWKFLFGNPPPREIY